MVVVVVVDDDCCDFFEGVHIVSFIIIIWMDGIVDRCQVTGQCVGDVKPEIEIETTSNCHGFRN
jgi:hypothetical protein